MFLLPLRNVDENCSLAQLLVKEHELEDVDTQLVDKVIRGEPVIRFYSCSTAMTNTHLEQIQNLMLQLRELLVDAS